MGRGNYCPKGDVSDQWYIDHSLYQIVDEAEEYEIDYDLMQDDVSEVMDAIKERFPSFYVEKKNGDDYWGERYMLENKLFRVGTADNQWSEAVFIQMRDDLGPEQVNLAHQHFPRYREGIKKIMLEFFGEIHLRSGPWMSKVLKKEEALSV